MNKQTFQHILSNPYQLTDAQLSDLEDLVTNFPYCQIAHVLIAKAYKDRGNMLSDEKVKTAAAYTSDRSLLKEVIEKPLSDEKNFEDQGTQVQSSTTSLTQVEGVQKEESLDSTSKEDVTEVLSTTYDEVLKEKDTYIEDIGNADQPKPVPALIEATSAKAQNISDDLAETLNSLRKLREAAEKELEERDKAKDLVEKEIPQEKQAETEEVKNEEVIEANAEDLSDVKATAEREDTSDVSEAVKQENVTVQDPKGQLNDSLEEQQANEVEDKAAHEDLPKQRTEVDQDSVTEIEEDKVAPAKPDVIVKQTDEDDILKKIHQISQDARKKVDSEKKRSSKKTSKDDLQKNKIVYQNFSSRLEDILTEFNIQDKEEKKEESDLLLDYLTTRRSRKTESTSSKSSSKKTTSKKAASNKKEEVDQSEIIEKFISEDPSISRSELKQKYEQQKKEENLAERSIKKDFKIVTENLARINAKQGNINQAIAIYKELMKKKPEKKLYFAEQIEKLRDI